MKSVIVLFFSFIPLLVLGQDYFEGRIQYVYEVKAKSNRINLGRLQGMLGKGSTLLFKDGNFRHDYDGGLIEFDIYNKGDNREYVKKRDNDTIYWYDCSKGGTPIKDLKTSPQKKKILGILCDQLRIQYSDHSKVEYYNSDSISVNPKWFTEFKRHDQYKIDAIERSIFLRSELDYPAFSIVSQATKVERKTVAIGVFDVSRDAILIENE